MSDATKVNSKPEYTTQTLVKVSIEFQPKIEILEAYENFETFLGVNPWELFNG